MSYLVLVRHGLSEYNKKGLWTGWDDPDLVEEGRQQAKKDGESLKDIHFDTAYISVFKRAEQSLQEIKKALGQLDLPTIKNPALNERNYGDYTGKNKWQVEKEIGSDEFKKLRRGWDYPLPNGESLKQVYERLVPYYLKEIEPKIKSGQNIIIVSSGNALRTLIKYLENLSDDQIANFEFGLGEVYIYKIGQGKVLSKEIRDKNPNAGKI